MAAVAGKGRLLLRPALPEWMPSCLGILSILFAGIRINAYNVLTESRGCRRLTIVAPLEVTRAFYEEDSQDIYRCGI